MYPYLLRGVSIERPDQVWSTDITYMRPARGFISLVAILDWYSRYVLSWAVSVTLDLNFCLEAVERAFTERLVAAGVRISMDGRGRALDNVFVERLWRSVKYEEVYLKDYATVPEAISGLDAYFAFYNRARLHQALAYRTPEAVYLEGRETHECRPSVMMLTVPHREDQRTKRARSSLQNPV